MLPYFVGGRKQSDFSASKNCSTKLNKKTLICLLFYKVEQSKRSKIFDKDSGQGFGISVGVLSCFGGGAVRRVGIQVNLKDFPSRPRRSLRMAAAPPKEFPGHN